MDSKQVKLTTTSRRVEVAPRLPCHTAKIGQAATETGLQVTFIFRDLPASEGEREREIEGEREREILTANKKML